MLRGGDEGLVGIIVAEVYVGFVLEDWVIPAVVDSEGDEGDVLAGYGSLCYCCVLGLEVGCKFCFHYQNCAFNIGEGRGGGTHQVHSVHHTIR